MKHLSNTEINQLNAFSNKLHFSDYDLNFALLQTRLNDVNEKVQYEGNL